MTVLRGKPDGEDSRNKRQQILDAALQVFSSKGYHKATVDEIIALADTGKGTVYNYFVNKEQLFYTLIKERSAPFEIAIVAIVDSKDPVLDRIRRFIKVLLKFYVTNAELWRVLMHDMRGIGTTAPTHLTTAQWEKYREPFANTIGMLEKVVQEGIAEGILKECDTTKMAYALFSVIITMIFHNLVSDDTDETANTIAELFFYGAVIQ